MGYSNTVRMAIRSIRRYWENCKFDKLKDEAMKDHKQALNEIIKSGFTWGLKHQLPFNWQELSKSDIISIRNSLYPKPGGNGPRNYKNKNVEKMKET